MESLKKNTADGEGSSERNTQPEDVEWLSSLSEPELDLLISLKELATRRAKNVGYKDLSDKFDVRMLRALGCIMLEYFKERVQNSHDIPDSAEALRLLNESGLASLNCEGHSDTMPSIEGTNELGFVTERRKRMWDGLCEEKAYSRKRQKIADTEIPNLQQQNGAPAFEGAEKLVVPVVWDDRFSSKLSH